MNDQMWKLVVINAIAIINVHGIATGLQYMTSNGMTLKEATDIVTAYDLAFNRVISGQLP